MAPREINGAVLRARLVRALLESEGMLLGVSALARKIGVHRTTLRRHLAAARAEVERLLSQPIDARAMAEIERALWLRAREGSVQAAKLLFARLKLIEAPAVPDDPTQLVDEIRQLVEQRDDAAEDD
jgi:transposase-like protein